MTKAEFVRTQLKANRSDFHSIFEEDLLIEQGVAFIDFSGKNPLLSSGTIGALEHLLKKSSEETGAGFLAGGYAEKRNLYLSSPLFNEHNKEPRDIHLGIDIWAPEGTAVYAPVGGTIHSFGNNNLPGDYGPTIIIEHQFDANNFFSLYGHLRLKDLGRIREGQFVSRGEIIGYIGKKEENGGWPPHLHFQLIIDMKELRGDYPGVCTDSEKENWLENSPDPELMLNLQRFVRNQNPQSQTR